jgi:antitoxin component YwqK of YwqJK toxin-antitoxin module
VDMNYFILFSISILLLCGSCGGNSEVTDNQNEKNEFRPLIEVIDGVYTEWYPGHKQIKIRGRQSDDGTRQGVWKSYSEAGYEASVVYYVNGKKDGYTVVYHPNGALHFRGEYRMDEKVGLWSFYDENGELAEEINFDTLPDDAK